MAAPKRSKRCAHIKDDGNRCRAWKSKGSEFCFIHNPDLESTRVEALQAASRTREARKDQRAMPTTALGRPELIGEPPKDRAQLRDLVAKTICWTIAGDIDTKRADAVIKLAQRGMALFPEAKEIDPHDQLEDPELYEALQKEVRAVEQRLIKAGHFPEGHTLGTFKSPLVAGGNGTPEPEKPEPPTEAAEWPEVTE